MKSAKQLWHIESNSVGAVKENQCSYFPDSIHPQGGKGDVLIKCFLPGRPRDGSALRY